VAPMKQLVSAVVVAAALVACAGSNPTGVTNEQAPGASECLGRGAKCFTSNDCCSEFCANGFCAQKQPQRLESSRSVGSAR
jgi:hypothetical protein